MATMDVHNNTTTNTTTTTSSTMLHSSVAEFYQNKTIFITGGTGFMGKVLLEKLIRSCPGISKIYLLIRAKRGQASQERLQHLLNSPLFDRLRKERPDDLKKIIAIEGDITQPELAISNSDIALLSRSVNLVFHSAATVKFDEKLKLSVTINMLGTQRLVELCKRMDHLEALVHVSTAYCNCDRTIVRETIYPPPIAPEQVSTLVDALDESLVDTITPRLVGNRPNTYTFTKALTESWLQENHGDIPVAIVRPSIVLSSINEPMTGWVDNWNGPTGIIAAAGKGIFRTMLCHPDKVADFIPVDMVINLMLVTAWKTATAKSKEILVFNCSTGQRMPITWSKFIGLCFVYMRKHPFSEVTWYPDGKITDSVVLNKVNTYLLHWLPAWIMDTAVWIVGGKPIMLKIQDKLSKASKCLEYFTTNQWQFEDGNVQRLFSQLSNEDKKEFNFDVSNMKWEEYVENYVLGIRRFMFKEDEKTIPKARSQLSKYYWFYRCLQVLSVMSVWHFLTLRYAPLRQLWSNALRLLLHIARMMPLLHKRAMGKAASTHLTNILSIMLVCKC
ncbi:uncharacterized protein CBL_02284 [Carabus blaptoides fortunei]